MESSQSLAIESFSDSWLTSISSSLESLQEPLRASLDSSHEATAEELEYRISKLKISLEEVQNFHFDVPSSPCPDAVVDADQLFSKGLIKPVFISQSKTEAYSSLDLVSKMHSSFSTSAVVPTVHIHCHIFRRWRKAPLRILQKCFRYLRPLCHKISGSIQSTSTDDIDGRARQIKGQNNSPQASPGTTDWSHIESSIYEAVLHCKRSLNDCFRNMSEAYRNAWQENQQLVLCPISLLSTPLVVFVHMTFEQEEAPLLAQLCEA